MYRILFERLKGKRPVERPRYRWRIILKWIFEKEVKVWTGFTWLGMISKGGFLKIANNLCVL
jgi:hypothetical protein